MEIPKSLQPGVKASPKPKPTSAKPANAKPVAAGLKASAAAPQPNATAKSASAQLDAIHQKVIQSIEAAAKSMSTARPKIEKAKASREDRNNVVSKGGEVVGALLAPGRRVADLLGALGPLFPPCKRASIILAALIKFESDRHKKDVRVSVVYFDLARALAHVGALNRKSRPTKLIVDTLGESLKNFKGLMEEFGQFCEAYYETKAPESRLEHLLHWKNNKDNLNRFTYRIEWLKRDLIGLLSQQAVHHPGQHADTLAQIESQLLQNRAFYYSIRDANEEFAEAFVSNHGGEATVQTVSSIRSSMGFLMVFCSQNGNILKQLAISVGESITPSILNAIKETPKTTSKQSRSAFESKLKSTLDKWASGSQQKSDQTGPDHNSKAVQKKAQTGPDYNPKAVQKKAQTGPDHNPKAVQKKAQTGPDHNPKAAQKKAQTGPDHNPKAVQKKAQTGPDHNPKAVQKKAQTGPDHNPKAVQKKAQTGPDHNPKAVQKKAQTGPDHNPKAVQKKAQTGPDHNPKAAQKKAQTGPDHNPKAVQKKAQTGPDHNPKAAQKKAQTGPKPNAKVVQKTRNKGRGEIAYHPLEDENANVELVGDDEGPYVLEDEGSGGVPDTDDDENDQTYLQNDEEAIREVEEGDDNDGDDSGANDSPQNEDESGGDSPQNEDESGGDSPQTED
ncbi:hypothetical protein BC827DRAFT_1378888, partial [Russula dissimulans]